MGGRSRSSGGGRRRGRKGRAPVPGGGARLLLGVRAAVAKRWAFRAVSVGVELTLGSRCSSGQRFSTLASGSSGEGAGPAVGRVGREEAVKAAGRGGGEDAAGAAGGPVAEDGCGEPFRQCGGECSRARPFPTPPPALGSFPGAAPSTTFPCSHLVPSAGFCFRSLGFADLSIPPACSPLPDFFLVGGCQCGGAWGLEWALRLCKEPVLINFAWGKQEAKREPAGSWEVWPCRL